MAPRPVTRLRQIKESIREIHGFLDGKSEVDLRRQRLIRLSVERLLEMISEASRQIPEEWKQEFGGEIPWQKIAAFGNVLRHTYDNVDIGVLWSVYLNDLDPLEAAIDAMLAAHAPKDHSP